MDQPQWLLTTRNTIKLDSGHALAAYLCRKIGLNDSILVNVRTKPVFYMENRMKKKIFTNFCNPCVM